MAIVGYMEGTDSLVLTRLNLEGVGTRPLGNGFDGHGKYVGHLTKQDNVSLVISYLHKILPTADMPIGAGDFLIACRTHGIPVLVIAPSDMFDRANEVLGNNLECVILVSPDEVYEKALEILEFQA
jgi:hypothetical protein